MVTAGLEGMPLWIATGLEVWRDVDCRSGGSDLMDGGRRSGCSDLMDGDRRSGGIAWMGGDCGSEGLKT